MIVFTATSGQHPFFIQPVLRRIILCDNQEAKRLCGGALSIYPYHGGSRRKDPAFLAKFDMVVTTYGVVQVCWGGPVAVTRFFVWKLWRTCGRCRFLVCVR